MEARETIPPFIPVLAALEIASARDPSWLPSYANADAYQEALTTLCKILSHPEVPQLLYYAANILNNNTIPEYMRLAEEGKVRREHIQELMRTRELLEKLVAVLKSTVSEEGFKPFCSRHGFVEEDHRCDIFRGDPWEVASDMPSVIYKIEKPPAAAGERS